MRALERPWGRMHWRRDGDASGPLVVVSNSPGTDLRLWDALLPHLPAGLRLLRYDKRGHGLSEPGGEQRIADLADDAAALIAAAGGGPCAFVGLSIGGLIGQDLAHRRPGLLRALVLVSTAARIGTREVWDERLAAVGRGGTAATADGAMERCSSAFRATPALSPWRTMLERAPAEGWAASGRAVRDADFRAANPRIALPPLVLAGAEDGSTPPALVEEAARTIPGAAFHLIAGTGHLPPVEAPEAMARLLGPLLAEHAR